jgi:hypothetical protein
LIKLELSITPPDPRSKIPVVGAALLEMVKAVADLACTQMILAKSTSSLPKAL